VRQPPLILPDSLLLADIAMRQAYDTSHHGSSL
jgi:hypothetical protein